MEKNHNQIIKQALEIVSENNKFAIKTIANNNSIKTNFYKLSSEPEIRLPSDERDLVDSVDDEPKSPPTPTYDIKFENDPEAPKPPKAPKDSDDPETETKDKRSWYQKIKDWIERDRVKFIQERYGIDATELSDEDVAKMLGHRYSPGPRMPSSDILNTNIGKRR